MSMPKELFDKLVKQVRKMGWTVKRVAKKRKRKKRGKSKKV